MKTTLLAAVAAAAAAMSFSSSAAFADSANTSLWRPHGPVQTTKKLQPARTYKHVHVTHRHVYRPGYRPGPVQVSAANLAAVRRQVHADGRVTLIEKFKLGAAERRHAAVVRSYR